MTTPNTTVPFAPGQGTNNHEIDIGDDDDFFDASAYFLDASEFCGSDGSSMDFSFFPSMGEVGDCSFTGGTAAESGGRRGIAWNHEVTAVGLSGSLSKIPLAKHDGFHDCKRFFVDKNNKYYIEDQDGANSLNLEDVALMDSSDESITLLDSTAGLADASPTGTGATAAETQGPAPTGSGLMTSIADRVSNMFGKGDNSNEAEESDLLHNRQPSDTSTNQAGSQQTESMVQAGEANNNSSDTGARNTATLASKTAR